MDNIDFPNKITQTVCQLTYFDLELYCWYGCLGARMPAWVYVEASNSVVGVISVAIDVIRQWYGSHKNEEPKGRYCDDYAQKLGRAC